MSEAASMFHMSDSLCSLIRVKSIRFTYSPSLYFYYSLQLSDGQEMQKKLRNAVGMILLYIVSV